MMPDFQLTRPTRVLRYAALLLLAPAFLGAQNTRSARAVPPITPGCPFAATLPSGWQRVPPLTARVNSARHMRITYGAGPDNVVLINVRFSDNLMARSEQKMLVTNGLMVDAAPLTFARKPAAVLRSVKNADALAGKGGSDVWTLYLPWDDERYAVVAVMAIAAKGIVPPTDATIRTLLGGLVSGACLADDEPVD